MGLQLIPNNLSIDFVGMRRIAYAFSLIILLVGIGSVVVRGGLSYGIDFAGGTVVQMKFDRDVNSEELDSVLEKTGFAGLVIQSFGDPADNSFLIRVSSTDLSASEIRETMQKTLAEAGLSGEIQRLESVGPKVGADLRSKALEAMFYATLIIAIYISGRFEQRWVIAGLMAAALSGGMYLLGMLGVGMGLLVLAATIITVALCWKFKLVFALGAVVSILHDVLVTVGIFALMGKEFDLTIIAALLTIVGYSLNDTIIVFDRIRENLRLLKGVSFTEIINRSINQTLSRTVLTSGTTLIVIGSLLLFGGGIIHDFALVMFIGVIVGTLSSMFIAAPILHIFGDTILAQTEAREKARAEEEVRSRNRRVAQV